MNRRIQPEPATQGLRHAERGRHYGPHAEHQIKVVPSARGATFEYVRRGRPGSSVEVSDRPQRFADSRRDLYRSRAPDKLLDAHPLVQVVLVGEGDRRVC
jgi:hypothetical protein